MAADLNLKWEEMSGSLGAYLDSLTANEYSVSTVKQYRREIDGFLKWLAGAAPSKEKVILYKRELLERYRPSTVNVKLAALNGFFNYLGYPCLRVKKLAIQHQAYCPESRELGKKEYLRLVREARKEEKEKLALIMETICATGIRVSELRFVTAEAVVCGEACVHLKRKDRIIFIPEKLRAILSDYMEKQKITSGPVFVTRNHRPVDRSNICRQMKSLCEKAEIDRKKVFPHNLRHLFARSFYEADRDIAKLADVLGHTSIDTTRIYICSSGKEHRVQMEKLGLIP